MSHGERAYDALLAAGAADVTPTQARLMAQIDPDGTRVVTLAARARITQQSAAPTRMRQLEETMVMLRARSPIPGPDRLVARWSCPHRWRTS